MKAPDNKPRLVIDRYHCFLHSIGEVSDYFEIKLVDTYDPVAGDLFLISDYDLKLTEKIYWAKNNKVKIIVDCLWEQQPPLLNDPDILLLQHKLWFWVHEYYYNLKNQIDKIEFDHSKKILKGFMPIRLRRDFRTTIVKTMSSLLDDFIWSYDDKKLPGDNSNDTDRLLLPEWYNKTLFSLVVETAIKGEIFITEKTFKPLFCGHPFMIVGQSDTLTLLKNNDFVTYDNIFDESYDQEADLVKKLKIIKNNCEAVCFDVWDAETLHRIDTNQKVFYDESKVKSVLYEIITEMYQHAET